MSLCRSNRRVDRCRRSAVACDTAMDGQDEPSGPERRAPAAPSLPNAVGGRGGRRRRRPEGLRYARGLRDLPRRELAFDRASSVRRPRCGLRRVGPAMAPAGTCVPGHARARGPRTQRAGVPHGPVEKLSPLPRVREAPLHRPLHVRANLRFARHARRCHELLPTATGPALRRRGARDGECPLGLRVGHAGSRDGDAYRGSRTAGAPEQSRAASGGARGGGPQQHRDCPAARSRPRDGEADAPPRVPQARRERPCPDGHEKLALQGLSPSRMHLTETRT